MTEGISVNVSQTIKKTRDVLAVPATGAGVERESSISGRIVTKQRSRLSPTIIRDLQYKR